MTFREDGNVIGRLGALAVIGLALWGVHRICGTDHCPVGGQPLPGCCRGEGTTAEAKPAPAPAATPATR